MLVYFAVILTVLLGFCGLAIDVGRMELRTNQLQAAADAGAIAAATELWHGGTNSNYITAATNDITSVETLNGLPASTNTVVIGATYGPYVGDSSTVQVTVAQTFPTIFLGVIRGANSTVPLSVKAVAQMPPCLLFMGNPTMGTTTGFYSASAGLGAPVGCPLYSTTGMVVDSFGRVNGSQTRMSGPAASSLIQGGTQFIPVYNVPLLPDPLAYIPAPSVANCSNATPISKLNQPSSTTINYTPGTYCGKTTGPVTTPAMDIEGSHSGGANQDDHNGGNCTSIPTVNFAAGLYVFVGGFNFYCVNATGSGVTMYFTKNSTVGFGQSVFISSNWAVSAPNDASGGGIAGIAIMGDRTWSGGNQDFAWTYSTWAGDGVIYTTGTGIDAYALQMSAPNYLNIVTANMYSYDANIHPSNNYANLPNGNPLHTVIALVQ